MDRTVTDTQFQVQETVISHTKLLNAANYPEFAHYLLLCLTKDFKDNQKYVVYSACYFGFNPLFILTVILVLCLPPFDLQMPKFLAFVRMLLKRIL